MRDKESYTDGDKATERQIPTGSWGSECVCFFFFLADAFIQNDLQGCIHIFTFTLMAHCTSGAIRSSVSCSRTLRQGIELTTNQTANTPSIDPVKGSYQM